MHATGFSNNFNNLYKSLPQASALSSAERGEVRRGLYLSLLFTFIKVGAFTLGGGYAMVPIMQKEVVDKHHWLTEEEFLNILAVSQSMPGLFAMNMASHIGYKLRRLPGGIISTIGVALPSILIILLIAMFFQSFKENKWVENAFRAIRPAVVALIAAPCFSMARSAHINRRNIWIPILACLLIAGFHLSPIWIILIAGLGGFFYGKWKTHPSSEASTQSSAERTSTQSSAEQTSSGRKLHTFTFIPLLFLPLIVNLVRGSIFVKLFLVFSKIGIFNFGGGYAMLSLIHNEVVVKNQWMSSAEFTDIVAISQSTPGPIGINCATYVGYTAVIHEHLPVWAGVIGSLIATLSVIWLPFLLMLLVSRFLIRHHQSKAVADVFSALRPAIIGLIAAAALLLMSKENFSSPTDSPFAFIVSIIIFCFSFIGTRLYKIHPILMIILCGIAGLFIYS